jgi:hypothetical protein
MEAEHLGEHPDALLVAGGDVDPHEPLLQGDEQLELLDGLLLDAAVGDHPDVHDPPPPCPDAPVVSSGYAAGRRSSVIRPGRDQGQGIRLFRGGDGGTKLG